MTRNSMKLQDQIIERASEVAERADEVKSQVTERGSELREQAVGAAERVRQAVSQAPKDRRVAKLACSGAALIRDRARCAQFVTSPEKVTYELVSLVSGVLGGALAGAIFNRIWRFVSPEDEAPEPAALERNIREVLIAGALQGAVFGLVKAVSGRITAQGYRKFTGNRPNR